MAPSAKYQTAQEITLPSGNVAMEHGGVWSMGEYLAAGVKLGMIQVPYSKQKTSYGQYSPMCVFTGSKQKQEAFNFIYFCTANPDGQKIIVDRGQLQPTLKSMRNDYLNGTPPPDSTERQLAYDVFENKDTYRWPGDKIGSYWNGWYQYFIDLWGPYLTDLLIGNKRWEDISAELRPEIGSAVEDRRSADEVNIGRQVNREIVERLPVYLSTPYGDSMKSMSASAKSPGRLPFYQRLSFEETFWGWLLIIPSVLGLILFRFGPVLASLYFSFTKYEIISSPKWIGLTNYQALMTDTYWLKSIQVTLNYSVLFIPLSLIVAYVIGLLMSQELKGIALYRTMWYLPSLVPTVASAVVWRWALNPEFGPVNYPLRAFGFDAPGWLTDPHWIIRSVVLIQLWGLGNAALIFLAAIKGRAGNLLRGRRGGWRQRLGEVLEYHSADDFIGDLLSR